VKKLLNTLYLTTEGAWARKEGAAVVVDHEGETLGRAPLHLLGAIICFGRIGLSPQLMEACCANGVTITFLNPHGRFLARVDGAVSGNVLLRRAQHRSTVEAPLPIAAAMVAAKIANQRAVLRRHLRDHGDQAGRIDDVERRLTAAIRAALAATDLDGLRGIEGDAASGYFSVFNALIRVDAMSFAGRSRRPPRDAPNALLSFLYVLLAADCRGALEAVGLDPQMGFLHADRPGRPSLALDLAEEFRAPMADRLVLSLLNRRQLGPKDFRAEETGGVFLTEHGRKIVLEAWQNRKRDVLAHPFLNEKLPLGLFPQIQAQLLARHLRGDLDGYPAFFWR
jgi:CRISPR-associated protein Cas1